MCPMCVGGAVAMATGMMSSGGLATLAWKRLGVKMETKPKTKVTGSVTKTDGGKNESANATK
jgi:hypothetical protein